MRRTLAIAGLTCRAAFRYRLFWVMAALLGISVVGLPLVLKGDGTAEGLTQILITYTLAAATTLLGFFTLWFSCGTMARDVEECQMQMVCVKPIGRWQVWLGKWLGILAINAGLLAIAGSLDYFLLQYRAGKLSADQQRILHEKIFVARSGVRDRPPDLSKRVEADLEQWKKNHKDQQITQADADELRKQALATEKAYLEEVAPGTAKYVPWVVDLSRLPEKVRHQPLELRVKFHAAQVSPAETYQTIWAVGSPKLQQSREHQEILPPDSFQEFQIPPDMLDPQGRMWIEVFNPNDTTLTFPLEDGFELLYYENTFAVNFVRGLLVILCWMGLLSLIGLAAASELSFPVAAFAALAVLIMGLFSGTLATVVEQNTIFGFNSATTTFNHTWLDEIVVPVFKGALAVINLVQGFSPIDSLSTGRSITWGQLGMAVGQIIGLLGGFFALVGIGLFSRRELAAVQTT